MDTDRDQLPENMTGLNSATLQLIYEESKDAHEQLMAEIKALEHRTQQLVQTSLVGLLFTAVGSDLSGGWTGPEFVFAFVAAIFIALSGIWATWMGLPRRSSAGTLFPQVLQQRVTEAPDIVKMDLLVVLSRSYHHYQQELLKRGARVAIAGGMQLFGMIIIAGLVVIEAPI
jgi:hypothetical protein